MDKAQYYEQVLMEIYRRGATNGQFTLAELAIDAVQRATDQDALALKLYAIRQNCLDAALKDIIRNSTNPYNHADFKPGLQLAAEIAGKAIAEWEQRERELLTPPAAPESEAREGGEVMAHLLSPDAQRILAAIQTHGGLQVTWRYRQPYPEYADGTDMPDEDWKIVERELYQIERHPIDMKNGTGVVYINGWHSDYLRTMDTYSGEDCVISLWTVP